jgi:pyruvate,water dikinase
MPYAMDLEDLDRAHSTLVGGKAANLGELARIAGVRVPAGFCVTTDAFDRVMAEGQSIDKQLDRLSRLQAEDRDAIAALSADIRRIVERATVPDDLVAAISRSLARLGEHAPYAVRSSATAEDLPTASFAGQQDSYLNVVGATAVVDRLRRCWASLFTERAVTYRIRNGFDHRKVRMAVIVQRMVFPQAAGVLFTADPVSANRKVASVEASPGLGEAMVSGLVTPDVFKVRDGEVVGRTIATKRVALRAAPEGGTRDEPVAPQWQKQPALTDAEVVALVQLGRRIEAHFGCPQDVEWCLVGNAFEIVQSRPITTLFPIPEAGDGEPHVYVSVGHQQMMTDAMKPLGLSVWQLTTPRPMAEAGGRLFVDVARALASPAGRAGNLALLGRSDPLTGDALQTIADRGDLIRPLPDEPGAAPVAAAAPAEIETDPAIVTELIERSEASLATLKREIRSKAGTALLDFIVASIEDLKRVQFDPRSLEVIMAGMGATWWLNERLEAWLGERNAADVLTQSVPHNVTAEMGWALLDVADAIRPHPDVVKFLQRVEDEGCDDDRFLDELARVAGGREAHDAIRGWLDRYGMRCAGEIDITRPRWSERPTALVPMILSNVRNFEPDAGTRRFEQGRQEALRKRQEVLERLRALPAGDLKAEQAERMIDRVRTFAGYREYPKYGMVSRYFVYKQALLAEAERLVQDGVLTEREDVFYLRLEELRDVLRANHVNDELIRERKEAFATYQGLVPPRVLTSEGEVFAGEYRRDDVPAGALAGLAVSAGTVEGRARVILDVARADLEPGDILVTAYTDPSWTPLFVAISGLVTEVGGLMSHGAVIAREYGLPAIVGVQHATRRIKDGQRIRVHATDGYVELLT